MRRQSIPLSKLRLDSGNPRLEGEGMMEDDLIYALLEAERGEVEMITLIDDIVENGLSPIDLVMVYESGDEFVVLEGNRRIAALKLMTDPSRAPEDFPKLVRKLSSVKRSAAPKSLASMVAPNREAGRHWIDRKHGGPAGGAGTKQWGPEQKTRFSGGTTGQTAIAIAITTYLLNHHPDSPELIAAVTKARRKSTNLGRILQFEPFQTEFGIRVRKGKVESTAGIEDDLSFWISVLNALGDLTVSTIHTRDQRTAFVQRAVGFRTRIEDAPPTDSTEGETTGGTGETTLTGNDDYSMATGQSGAPDSTRGRDATADSAPELTSPTTPGIATATEQPDPSGLTSPVGQPKPKYSLFPGLSLYDVSIRVQALLWEAQKLDLSKSLNTGAILIRIVVELATDDAVSAGVVKDATIDTVLGSKITKALAALTSAGVHKTTTGPVGRFVSSPEFRSLHDYVHSTSAFPTSAEAVRNTSAIFVPYLRELDRLIRTAAANGDT